MSRGLLFAALTLFVTVSAHAIPVQWQVSSGGNGHFYDVVFSQQLLTWTDANTAALALPGGWHLATLTSSAESAFAESLLDPTQYTDCVSGTLGGTICTGVWIGALSSAIGSNDWQWVTGETFSYTDWGPFEPFSNGDRIRLDRFQSFGVFSWNDARNTANPAHGYILEQESTQVPEAPTVILLGCGLGVLLMKRARLARVFAAK